MKKKMKTKYNLQTIAKLVFGMERIYYRIGSFR